MTRWLSINITTYGYLVGGFSLGVLVTGVLLGLTRSSAPFMMGNGQTSDPARAVMRREERRKFVVSKAYDGGRRPNNSVADDMFRRVKVLCFVILEAEQVPAKRSVYQQTWGRRCHRLLLFSNLSADEETITLDIPAPTNNIEDDSMATLEALRYLFRHHLEHAQWFIRLHPMTYVVFENLRFFLHQKEYTKPVYFGQFMKHNNLSFPLGNGGYVMSKKALSIFGKQGSRKSACRPTPDSECVVVGRCFKRLGIQPGDSRDAVGRSIFHGIAVESISVREYPDWFAELDVDIDFTKQGISSVSDNAITFGPVSDATILAMEYFTYYSQIYG